MRFTLFVPADHQGGPLAEIIRGSAIVGRSLDGGQVVMDYEGNKHSAQNLRTYADRVFMAATRQAEGYPTVARRIVMETAVREVGTFDWETGVIEIPMSAHAALTRWLDIDTAEVPEHELRRTSVVMAGDGEETATA